MTATKYTFSIQGDFPNHKVSSDRLMSEIRASAIVTALDGVQTTGDVCDVLFKDALSTYDETILDGLVATHSGEPVTPDPIYDPQGAPYVSLLLGKPGLKLCIKGTKFDAPINATTNDDVTFPQDREIQGSWLEVANHQPGDYVEMLVCLPDGTIVGQFGETVFIPPSGKIDQIVAEGTAPLPAGIKLRLAYTAVNSGVTRVAYVWHRLRK
jgi:hypothetical protein